MVNQHLIMGLFTDDARAAEAIAALKAGPWALQAVHSPVPSAGIAEALALKKSEVGWFTLAGGIIGFFAGFLLAAFTASQWNIMVSGKPVLSLVPFFIVGFEFTILFAVFGNVIGLIHQMQLPSYNNLVVYDERCSGQHYGVVAACGPEEHKALAAFFRERGAVVREFGEG